MTTNLEKINAELIEKGAIIVGRIYALKDKYRKEIFEIKGKLQHTENEYLEGKKNKLVEVIEDLEELTK
jgi:hypothetical protein